MNTQDWSPLGWTGWISLQSKGFARVFSNTTVQKHQFFGTLPSLLFSSHIRTWLSHPYMTTGKTIALTIETFVGKVMSMLFNTLSRFFIAFHDPFSSFQLLNRIQLFANPRITAHQASLSITNSQSLLKLMCIKSVMPSISSSVSPSPPDPNPSQHQSLFQWVNSSHQVAKVLEFQL